MEKFNSAREELNYLIEKADKEMTAEQEGKLISAVIDFIEVYGKENSLTQVELIVHADMGTRILSEKYSLLKKGLFTELNAKYKKQTISEDINE